MSLAQSSSNSGKPSKTPSLTDFCLLVPHSTTTHASLSALYHLSEADFKDIFFRNIFIVKLWIWGQIFSRLLQINGNQIESAFRHTSAVVVPQPPLNTRRFIPPLRGLHLLRAKVFHQADFYLTQCSALPSTFAPCSVPQSVEEPVFVASDEIDFV